MTYFISQAHLLAADSANLSQSNFLWLRRVLLSGVLVMCGVFWSPAPLSAALPMVVDGQPLPSLAPMLERIEGSVVNISTESEVRVRRGADPFFDDPKNLSKNFEETINNNLKFKKNGNIKSRR